MSPDSIDDYQMEQVYDGDIGQVVLIDGNCLVTQSSSKLMFYTQKEDKMTKLFNWKCYKTIKIRGAIYYIKDTNRMQVTTNEYIYFYMIDLDTYEPSLENVMYNYMSCNQMMIGKKMRYSVCYKSNQKSFDIYQRKYMHNLRVQVNDINFEGSKAIEIASMNIIVATNVDKLMLFETATY